MNILLRIDELTIINKPPLKNSKMNQNVARYGYEYIIKNR